MKKITVDREVQINEDVILEKGDNIKILIENFRLGNIEVAKHDVGNTYTWVDAMKLENDGWRLPTIKELELIYKNKDRIGNFQQEYYWSSTKRYSGSAWSIQFPYGRKDAWTIINIQGKVRLIRDI